MPTESEVQHEALVNLMNALPTIRRLNRSDSDHWTTQDRLYARSVLCHLDAYLTMLSQPTAPLGPQPVDLGPGND